ncbi:unnamed protein product [Pieris macdunnoughi]|uniref:Uncharacterized protein n=1 Tax=Pieris macdunnoughi TaxID=345717 RepID=A0A821RSB4_9NEOP|nr:unnamed protein product [Pieris macdunnoughi]
MCDIQEFLANLPSDIGNAVSNAWNNMIKAIKRPVRIRRLGRTGKTKTSPIPVTKPMVTLLQEQVTSTNEPLSTARSAKLIIPILATPHWKSMLDWRRQRLASNWITSKATYHYVHERTPDTSIASDEEELTHFGNLFFI